MMALWTVYGARDPRQMTVTKNLLVVAANVVAVVSFAVAGIIDWRIAFAMAIAASAGAWVGARWSRRVDPRILRGAIVGASAIITIAFFARALR